MKIIVSQTTETDAQGREFRTTKYDDGSMSLSMPCTETPLAERLTRAFLINYGKANPTDLEAAVDVAIGDARSRLPPGTLFEIRAKPFPRYGSLADYGRRVLPICEQNDQWGIAWIEVEKSAGAMFRESVLEAKEVPEVGCIVVARQEV